MRYFFIAAVMSVAIATPAMLSPAYADDVTVPTAETAERQASWYGQRYAVSGQDVVSFRSTTGPVAGSEEFKAEWDNTEWKFASAENRDAFLANPEGYVPEFGGYCPVALANGDAKIGFAKHFTITDDDKLYLNYDAASNDLFQKDTTGYITGAKLKF